MDRGKVIEILENGIEICNVTKTTQVHINVSVAERIVELLKEQAEEIKHLRLALGIMKGEGIAVNLNEVDDDKH